MANVLNITSADNGKVFALRADMSVEINFKPDNKFSVALFTQDTNNFTVNSNSGTFRQANGGLAPSLTFGGQACKFVMLMFDPAKNIFEWPFNNLNGGSASTGTGTTTKGDKGDPGTAATLSLGTYQQVPYNQPLEIIEGGTPQARTFSFKIPAGAPGTGGGGGTGGDRMEVVAPIVNGEVILDSALSNQFVIELTSSIRMVNPVGFTDGMKFTVFFVQKGTTPYEATWDTKWAFLDALAPGFSQNPNARVKMQCVCTQGVITCDVSADSFPDGYQVIRPIARIGAVEYYTINKAFSAMRTGQTVFITRKGKGAEAAGTINGADANLTGGTFIVRGQAIGGTAAEQRPTLTLLPTQRPAFGKAAINVEGNLTAIIRDLIITGVRSSEGNGSAICPNNMSNVDVHNVYLYNNNNGMQWGVTTGRIRIYDSLFDSNGVGSADASNSHGNGSSSGFVHNIYAGEGNVPWEAYRTTFSNSKTAHNIKSRGYCLLRQVLTRNAAQGREMDIPNGGGADVEDSSFEKTDSNSAQNDLIGIGQEGVLTTRTRSYVYKNCRFINMIPDGGRDATFINNKDTTEVLLIDPEFIGAGALTNNTTVGGFTTVAGLRGNVRVVYTGGPVGPRVPVGYFPVPMTPV